MAVVACQPNADRPAEVTVTDSAGITIVVNGPEQLEAAAEWTLAPEPSLEITTDEGGDVVLFQVGLVVPLPDDRIAVGNGGSSEVLVFERSGALALRLGGDGDGPGEFRRIASVMELPGDSVGVYDGTHRRLSVFGPEGALGRDLAVRDVMPRSSYAKLLPLANGDLVLFTGAGFVSGAAEGRPYRPESESVLIGPDGVLRASYGSFPGQELFQGQGLAGSPIFGAGTYTATLGDELIVGTAEAPEIRSYDPSGNLSRIVRWPDHDRRITPERWDTLFEATLAAVPPEQVPPNPREFFARIPVADEMPPYEVLIGSSDGHVWVGRYVISGPSVPGIRPPARRWLVFDADGVLVATTATPEGFAPHAVQGGEVFGVFTDELGVESVRVYGVDGVAFGR